MLDYSLFVESSNTSQDKTAILDKYGTIPWPRILNTHKALRTFHTDDRNDYQKTNKNNLTQIKNLRIFLLQHLYGRTPKDELKSPPQRKETKKVTI
jgi:hypothetical protein